MSIATSILPVFVFLASLVFLDSFKLVTLRSVLIAIVAGCVGGGGSYLANRLIVGQLEIDIVTFARYVAPVVEELLKSLFIIYLIRSQKLGFLVDGAIYGFAIGAGFAFVENIYYIDALGSSSMVVWLVRGFGTALMHGGTTAIFAVVAKTMAERNPEDLIRPYLTGYGIAVVIHSFFNHFFFSPLISTVLVLVVLPALMITVFKRSEASLRRWLGVGFDTDQELLQSITSGNLAATPVGAYLESLQTHFRPEDVVDMLCMLRLHLELSIQAKGILLMRDAGFEIPPDPDVRGKFDELRLLEKNIGKTGKLAILPFLHTSTRDLWQLHMLGGSM